MNKAADFRTAKIPLNDEAGQMPALGFGTLIPDPATTISATRDALEAGFRHFDCAERYRNEREVGETLRAGLAAARVGKTPAQVLLAWAVQRGTALLTTPKTAARARENFDISALPQDAFEEINGIQIRQRLNSVVKTGSPGFIPRGK
jgi:diketogulonate reductase-like aldo/keto reductase